MRYVPTVPGDHLVYSAMLGRAFELAFARRQIPASFYDLDDREALGFLGTATNDGTRFLVNAVQKSRPYTLAAGYEQNIMPFPCDWNHWTVQQAIADDVVQLTDFEPWEVATWVGAGRDPKDITAPFRNYRGGITEAGGPLGKMWRIRIYVNRPITKFPALILGGRLVPFCRRAVKFHLARHVADARTTNAGS